jgi:hypothetical protein
VPAYTTKTTQWLLAEFWFLADWPQYLPDFNPIQSILQAKVQATPHSNLAALCPSITSEWDQLAVVNIRKPAAHPAATIKPSLKKLSLN